MKLRILGNSIRLRLTRGEVDRVCAGEWVEESTRFAPAPASALVYRVGPGGDIEQTSASFSDGVVSVVLPASGWAMMAKVRRRSAWVSNWDMSAGYSLWPGAAVSHRTPGNPSRKNEDQPIRKVFLIASKIS